MDLWPLPVGVCGREHELELHDAGAFTQLLVLDAVQLVGDVSPADVHLRMQHTAHRQAERGNGRSTNNTPLYQTKKH